MLPDNKLLSIFVCIKNSPSTYIDCLLYRLPIYYISEIYICQGVFEKFLIFSSDNINSIISALKAESTQKISDLSEKESNNDIVFCTALIDTFVNKIYLSDSDDAQIKIYCNASEQSIKVSIGKPTKSSPMEQLAPPTGLEPVTTP